MQQAWLEQQQLAEQLQHQAAADQAQHAAILQEVKESSTAACAALQASSSKTVFPASVHACHASPQGGLHLRGQAQT